MEKKQGLTMSDWIVQMRKCNQGNLAKKAGTNKLEDLARLRNSSLPQYVCLPQYAWFDCSFWEFTNKNNHLMEFFSRYRGVCVRALPNQIGIQKGFTRKYKFGHLSFAECLDFLRENINGPKQLWDVSLSEWTPQKYGFILQSGLLHVRGEIGMRLDNLSHGLEEPLAGFIIDKTGIGHITDKTRWFARKDESAARDLWKSVEYIKAPWDNFDPFFLNGYFEGCITQGKDEVKFIDYKTSEFYLL